MRSVSIGCLTRKRLRDVWRHMIDRCHNAEANDFPRYGAKGVAVCDEWRASFQSFFGWAIASGYSTGMQIDRRENHRGYCPANCRWATKSQQQINKPGRSATGFKGVRRERYGRFSADIKVSGTRLYLGTFDTAEEAARAYDCAALEHFGEYARLNFPTAPTTP